MREFTEHEKLWRRRPSWPKNIQKINVLTDCGVETRAELLHLTPFFHFVNESTFALHSFMNWHFYQIFTSHQSMSTTMTFDNISMQTMHLNVLTPIGFVHFSHELDKLTFDRLILLNSKQNFIKMNILRPITNYLLSFIREIRMTYLHGDFRFHSARIHRKNFIIAADKRKFQWSEMGRYLLGIVSSFESDYVLHIITPLLLFSETYHYFIVNWWTLIFCSPFIFFSKHKLRYLFAKPPCGDTRIKVLIIFSIVLFLDKRLRFFFSARLYGAWLSRQRCRRWLLLLLVLYYMYVKFL